MKQEGTFNVAREWRTDFFEVVGTVRREIVISQAEGVKMSGRASQIVDCRKELLRVNRRVQGSRGNVE